MDNRPIGVFDSGVGGLTVVRALMRTLPHEDIVYLGDTARVPYGTKSGETVKRFSIQCAQFLRKHDVKIIVVACNSASSCALSALKKKFKIPVLGVIEPGVREACRLTRNRRIGVIGTQATVSSRAYVKGIKKLNGQASAFQQACPLFVSLVEENWLKGKITAEVAERYLAGLREKDIDTIILGCTHYPLLKMIINQTFKGTVRIVDSSVSVSQEVKRFLDLKALKHKPGKHGGSLQVYVTDDPASFKKVSRIFLSPRLKVRKVVLV